MPTTPTPRTALVVGASGLVGSYCLDALLADSDYTLVTVLGRRPLSRQHAKLHQHVVDFDDPGTYGARAVANDVFCCLGTTIKKAGSADAFRQVDFNYPVSIARAARANGATQLLIVSALGANARAKVLYSRVKGELETAATGLGFRAVHIFRPSLLVGPRHEIRPAERIALSIAVPLSFAFVGPLRRYRPIQARVVAACMIKTAKQDLSGTHVFESDRIQAC